MLIFKVLHLNSAPVSKRVLSVGHDNKWVIEQYLDVRILSRGVVNSTGEEFNFPFNQHLFKRCRISRYDLKSNTRIALRNFIDHDANEAGGDKIGCADPNLSHSRIGQVRNVPSGLP